MITSSDFALAVCRRYCRTSKFVTGHQPGFFVTLEAHKSFEIAKSCAGELGCGWYMLYAFEVVPVQHGRQVSSVPTEICAALHLSKSQVTPAQALDNRLRVA